MAQSNFRLNVTASQFPFLSDQEGATVIVPQNDTYYIRENKFTGETADRNIGIPQFTFVENVMPSSFGVQSVGYQKNTKGYPDGLDHSDQFVYLRSQTGRRYLMNFNRQSGRAFIYSPEIGEWIEKFNISAPLSQAYVCLVKGRCFLAFKNWNAIFEFKDFNTFTNEFEFFTYSDFIGITDLTPIFGIVSANNYLILFTRTLIFYTIPLETYGSVPDFTPSLGPTGAASETPSVLKGIILTCLPTQDGFYIFTSTNIVAAYYSGNIRFPWTYRELEGSAAINSLDVIGTDRDGYPKYAYTTAGLLKIGKSICTPVFVEASEFIGNNVYEYFDWITKEIIRVILPDVLNVSLSYISGRWLILSYGVQGATFSHALLWDEHLKRWGKVQINHSRAVEFFGVPATLSSVPAVTYQDLLNAGSSYQTLLSAGTTYAMLGGADYAGNPDISLEYKNIGFADPNGIIRTVDFSGTLTANQSVAILGRIQFTRNSRFKIVSIWLENLNDDPLTGVSHPTVKDLTYQDLLDLGWTYQQWLDSLQTYGSTQLTSYTAGTQVAVLSSNDTKNVAKTNYGFKKLAANGGVRKFQYARAEGVNHQLRLEGDFDLSSIVVVGTKTGSAYL